MNEIRRKLRSQRGVTVVFALVIFLIMALFSYVMVNASLTAAQGAAAGQFDQQAYLSTRSVAFMIRDALKQYPNFTVTDAGWENKATDGPMSDESRNLYNYVTNIQYQFMRSESAPSVWQIMSDSDEVKEKFGFVRVRMEPDFPSIIVKLEHCDYDKSKLNGYDSNSPSNYKMTVTITGKDTTPPETGIPSVSFSGTDITMTAQQGVS